MDSTVVKQILEALQSRQALMANLQRRLQAAAKPMPPNQHELRAPAIAGLDVIEVTLSRDEDEHAPIRIVTVLLKPEANLKLSGLEILLGTAELSDDTGKPPPAQLVLFPKISGEHGLEIGISARVDRPAGRESKVRSIQFVRSGPLEP